MQLWYDGIYLTALLVSNMALLKFSSFCYLCVCYLLLTGMQSKPVLQTTPLSAMDTARPKRAMKLEAQWHTDAKVEKIGYV